MTDRLAIVPAYNEEEAVGAVVRELRQEACDFDVLVIDDGSTDGTAAAAFAAGAKVVTLPFNLGIGGAVQTGYRYASERDYALAIQVDGDGQHDPGQIARLCDYMREHPEIDLVTGSRFLHDDPDGHRSTRTRQVGIAIFARVMSRIVGRRVSDPTSGFRLSNRRAIRLFADDYPHDYPEVEAVLLVHAHRLRSAEVPVVMRPRTSGVSSINASRSAYYMIKVLLAIFVGLFRARPGVEPGDEAPVAADHSI